MVPDIRFELKLIRHIFDSVLIVVDHYLVKYVVSERVEVGAASWLFQWNVVSEDCDRVRFVGADERVQICIVSNWIFGDLTSFSMRCHDTILLRSFLCDKWREDGILFFYFCLAISDRGFVPLDGGDNWARGNSQRVGRFPRLF